MRITGTPCNATMEEWSCLTFEFVQPKCRMLKQSPRFTMKAYAAALRPLKRTNERWRTLTDGSGILAIRSSSRRLCARHGFREVGTYYRHGQLDGAWRDVVIVERLLGEAAR